jgi:hypothetical protein
MYRFDFVLSFKKRRSEGPRFFGRNKHIFWHLFLQSLGDFSQVVPSKASS